MNNVWFQRAKRASLLYRRGGTRLVWDRAVAKVMTKLSTGRGGGSYEQWVASTTLSAAERQRQATDAAAWTTAPSIGILVAVDTDSPALFENTFRSLLSQTNPHWRAYVCPSPNVPAATTKLFSKLVREDSRFKMIHSPNGSWGAALETARKHASEKHLAIVDGGDELACDALFDLAQALRDRPDCDVLYSDEDRKLWPGNSRFGPMLKPDWSPETILGFNYFGRMLVLRAGLLASVGGFTPIWDAAREWDLVLRATRAARDIHHLPKCLYHRHARSADEHEATHAKVSDEHAEVLRRHLLTRGLAADVRVTADGVCRATWPYERKLASIIIPSRDKYELISRCIHWLLNQPN